MTDPAAWPPGSGEMARRAREHDWSETPLGKADTWPPELRSAASFVLESGFPAALVAAKGLVTIYNDAFASLLGAKPDSLGRSFADIWPEAWHEIGPIAARALAGDSTFIKDYTLDRSRGAEQAHFTFSYSPVRDAAGQVIGFIVTAIETTAGHLAAEERAAVQQELSESEARFRAYVTAGRGVVYRMNADWSELHQLNGQDFLADTGMPSRSWMDSYIDPADQALVAQAIKEAVQRKSVFELEHRVRRADGSIGWTASRAVPILDDQGEIIEWMGTAMDITASRRAKETLRDSEERLRRFGEASQDILWMRDAETLQWVYLTPAFETIYGLSRDDALAGDNYRSWLDLILPEDREHASHCIERVRGGDQVAFEYRIRRPSDGRIGWLRNTDFPISDGNGRIVMIGGVGQDVTELRESEHRSRLLLAELQHRVRNIMAMIRSIARRTGASSESVDDYVQHLEGRISAMARTQALITRDVHAAVDLEGLLRDELEMQSAQPSHYRVSGPDVALPPKAAEVLGLAIHELATNAVKYGALSATDGRVDVRWTLTEGEKAPQLSLTWSESGVRIESAPSRQGFGTELVTRRVPYELHGAGTIKFRPTGLVSTIEFPLANEPSILQTGFGSQTPS